MAAAQSPNLTVNKETQPTLQQTPYKKPPHTLHTNTIPLSPSPMAYSPKLQKQPSCSCPPLDIASWCSSRRRTGRFEQRFDDDDYYDEESDTGTDYPPTTRSSAGVMRWRGIWRRIVKEKRRIFYSGAPAHEPYDPYTYAQNFDEGTAWVEPENLSRSFSARFAVPGRMLRRLS